MAIKEVSSIPGQSPAPPSQRELVRRDVEEAFAKGIAQFEFEGSGYRYETLAGNAKEAIRQWFRRTVFYPAQRRAKERLKERIREPFWCTDPWEYEKRACRLTKRKLGDRTHVYCTLGIEMLRDMEQVIYDDTLKLYGDKWPDKIIR